MQETLVQFLGQEDLLEKGQATHSSILGLLGGFAGKESTCNAGDLGLIPGLGRSPGEGNSYPPQYSGLENSMDCIVHGAAKSRHLKMFLKATHIHSNKKIKQDKKEYSANRISLPSLTHNFSNPLALYSFPEICQPFTDIHLCFTFYLFSYFLFLIVVTCTQYKIYHLIHSFFIFSLKCS